MQTDSTTGKDTEEHKKALVFNDLGTRTGSSDWLFIPAQWQLVFPSSHISTQNILQLQLSLNNADIKIKLTMFL